MTAPGAPAAPAAGNDKTTLFGVLGIIFAFCCLPVGILFAVLSLLQAKKYGTSPTLAYVGFAIAAIVLLFNAVGWGTGFLSF